MKSEVTTLHGQPLQPSKMDDWSSTAVKSWAPINCTMETLLHVLLQQHPLGSLAEFRNNTMVALQQHSPQGTTLTPHFFNHGDTEGEKKKQEDQPSSMPSYGPTNTSDGAIGTLRTFLSMPRPC